MHRTEYWKLEGKTPVPTDWDGYVDTFRVKEGKRITHIGDETINGVRISTVFLPINHQLDPQASPLLFETMIFDSDGNVIYDYQERYSTWDEAEAGHKKAVELVKERLNKNETS